MGYGAMMELGPFRVNSDNISLSTNTQAWNNGEAHHMLLMATESPFCLFLSDL